MAIFQGTLLVILGLGLSVIVYRSLDTGWLPCGPNGITKRLEFRRDEQPFAYWLMFAGYGLGGLWLLTFGLRLLVGQAEPLPLQ